MKITEMPPAEPTYHIELSQAELNALYLSVQPDTVSEENGRTLALEIEDELLSHSHFSD